MAHVGEAARDVTVPGSARARSAHMTNDPTDWYQALARVAVLLGHRDHHCRVKRRGTGCASNEPPFRARFPEKIGHPNSKNRGQGPRCCLTFARREGPIGILASEAARCPGILQVFLCPSGVIAMQQFAAILLLDGPTPRRMNWAL
jgi:hypothetical protein